MFLLYGHKGWIGQQFCELLQSSGMPFARGRARADDKDAVERELEEVRPTHVFSFIGRTHGVHDGRVIPTVDFLEQPGRLRDNLRDNLLAPLTLASACASRDVHLTYLGTGCIFKYTDERRSEPAGGFTEEDLPNFFGSSYSAVKACTDRLVGSLFGHKVLNLRIRMPIAGQPHPRNFVTKITQYEHICSIPNSMTVLDELLPVAMRLASTNVVGTVNLTNPGRISHDEVLGLYRDIVDPSFRWKNFTEADQARVLAAERSNNLMNTDRLQALVKEAGLPPVRPIRDAVRSALESYRDACTPAYDAAGATVLVTGGC